MVRQFYLIALCQCGIVKIVLRYQSTAIRYMITKQAHQIKIHKVATYIHLCKVHEINDNVHKQDAQLCSM